MKWLAINAALQKIFKQAKKRLENPNLHLMTTFFPHQVTLFCSLKFLTLPMGLKESPSQKSVKPRVTFSCFKASFLWLSRTLWQWMNFCRDKPQHTIPNFQKCPKSSSLAKTYNFAQKFKIFENDQNGQNSNILSKLNFGQKLEF